MAPCDAGTVRRATRPYAALSVVQRELDAALQAAEEAGVEPEVDLDHEGARAWERRRDDAGIAEGILARQALVASHPATFAALS